MSYLYLLYVFVAFVLVSLTTTYELTAKIFNKGLVNNMWQPGTLNPGLLVHAVVLVLLLWLPMYIKHRRNKKHHRSDKKVK
jgi:uncharacterized membrane protein YciS (DUF1049 family)